MRKIFLITTMLFNLLLHAQNTYQSIDNTCPVPKQINIVCDNLDRMSIGPGAYELTLGDLQSSPRNTIIGSRAATGITTPGNVGSFYWDNTFIGAMAGSNSLKPSAHTYIGCRAGFGSNAGLIATFFANSNTYVGSDAGNTSIGGRNCFYGTFAGANSTAPISGSTSSNNNYFGWQTGQGTIGTNNCFFGTWEMNIPPNPIARASTNNCFFGTNAGILTNGGNNNVFMGGSSGQRNTTGSLNVFIGNSSGINNTTGSSNIFIGNSIVNSGAGGTGNGNIYIGDQAGNTLSQTGNNGISIGTNSRSGNISSNNALCD
ncbi:MAG: hypothetical protein U0U67_06475 [Chitinophagales bacterium]